MEIPTRSDLTRVGALERTIEASIERVWENVLDWEHLPWLHRTSFHAITCREAGRDGWRVDVVLATDPPRPATIELCAERDAGRYVSRTLEGEGAGTEIWTQLSVRDAGRTDITVEFWLPSPRAELRELLGRGYTELYGKLWDEDEAMMIERERQLAAHGAPPPPGTRVSLGPRVALSLPHTTRVEGHRVHLIERGGVLVAHSAVCPHRLGPLEWATDAPDVLECPWHGYRFDTLTGRSCDGRSLRLPRPPDVEVDAEGCVVLRWPRTGNGS